MGLPGSARMRVAEGEIDGQLARRNEDEYERVVGQTKGARSSPQWKMGRHRESSVRQKFVRYMHRKGLSAARNGIIPLYKRTKSD